MSNVLWQFYHKAHEIGKLNAQLRLAALTGCPASKIAEVAETPELIKKFEDAMVVIRGEFIINANTSHAVQK
jgi:hypothetical protein